MGLWIRGPWSIYLIILGPWTELLPQFSHVWNGAQWAGRAPAVQVLWTVKHWRRGVLLSTWSCFQEVGWRASAVPASAQWVHHHWLCHVIARQPLSNRLCHLCTSDLKTKMTGQSLLNLLVIPCFWGQPENPSINCQSIYPNVRHRFSDLMEIFFSSIKSLTSTLFSVLRVAIVKLNFCKPYAVCCLFHFRINFPQTLH